MTEVKIFLESLATNSNSPSNDLYQPVAATHRTAGHRKGWPLSSSVWEAWGFQPSRWDVGCFFFFFFVKVIWCLAICSRVGFVVLFCVFVECFDYSRFF